MNLTARWPNDAEVQVAREMLGSFRKRYQADPKSAEELISYGESEPEGVIDASDLAAYTMLANLLMNLDEVINKN